MNLMDGCLNKWRERERDMITFRDILVNAIKKVDGVSYCLQKRSNCFIYTVILPCCHLLPQVP